MTKCSFTKGGGSCSEWYGLSRKYDVTLLFWSQKLTVFHNQLVMSPAMQEDKVIAIKPINNWYLCRNVPTIGITTAAPIYGKHDTFQSGCGTFPTSFRR